GSQQGGDSGPRCIARIYLGCGIELPAVSNDLYVLENRRRGRVAVRENACEQDIHSCSRLNEAGYAGDFINLYGYGSRSGLDQRRYTFPATFGRKLSVQNGFTCGYRDRDSPVDDIGRFQKRSL